MAIHTPGSIEFLAIDRYLIENPDCCMCVCFDDSKYEAAIDDMWLHRGVMSATGISIFDAILMLEIDILKMYRDKLIKNKDDNNHES